MLEALKRRRAELDGWLTDRGLAHTFSLPAHQLHLATLPLVERVASSPCLDAGSGRSPWRQLLAAQGLLQSLEVAVVAMAFQPVRYRDCWVVCEKLNRLHKNRRTAGRALAYGLQVLDLADLDHVALLGDEVLPALT